MFCNFTGMNKIETSIKLLQNAESLALKYQPYGFHLAFSGGKDSQVIYHLAKMAGVKFKAFMQVTTIDPPALMKFVRKNYPDVIMQRPEMNFYELIKKKKSLPTRTIRYCCQVLKEQSGAGSVVVTGIRKAESARRNKRNELEISGHKYSNSFDQFNIDNESQILCISGKDKILLSPIINWTNADVWNFIRNNNIEYCKLYDEGYTRIGCVFCPMASVKSKKRDRKRYAGIEKQIKKSIDYLRELGKLDYFKDADDVFNWWVSNMSAAEYLSKKNQTELF
jgi:phosphoadenosine phosphosulfate reductase